MVYAPKRKGREGKGTAVLCGMPQEGESAAASVPKPPKGASDEEIDAYKDEVLGAILKVKRRKLGNIEFIGALYCNGMMKERVMEECMTKLLDLERVSEDGGGGGSKGGRGGPRVRFEPAKGEEPPDNLMVESACKLFQKVGPLLDQGGAGERGGAAKWRSRAQSAGATSRVSSIPPTSEF